MDTERKEKKRIGFEGCYGNDELFIAFEFSIMQQQAIRGSKKVFRVFQPLNDESKWPENLISNLIQLPGHFISSRRSIPVHHSPSRRKQLSNNTKLDDPDFSKKSLPESLIRKLFPKIV